MPATDRAVRGAARAVASGGAGRPTRQGARVVSGGGAHGAAGHRAQAQDGVATWLLPP